MAGVLRTPLSVVVSPAADINNTWRDIVHPSKTPSRLRGLSGRRLSKSCVVLRPQSSQPMRGWLPLLACVLATAIRGTSAVLLLR